MEYSNLKFVIAGILVTKSKVRDEVIKAMKDTKGEDISIRKEAIMKVLHGYGVPAGFQFEDLGQLIERAFSLVDDVVAPGAAPPLDDSIDMYYDKENCEYRGVIIAAKILDLLE